MMAVFRDDLRKLARVRLREAKVLLDAKLYAGAYHVAGFAVECALKACIAGKVRRYEFPDKRIAAEAWSHDPSKLVQLAGLSAALQRERRTIPALDANWAIVEKWKPEVRYDLSVGRVEAEGLYSAIAGRNHGVLKWIRDRW